MNVKPLMWMRRGENPDVFHLTIQIPREEILELDEKLGTDFVHFIALGEKRDDPENEPRVLGLPGQFRKD